MAAESNYCDQLWTRNLGAVERTLGRLGMLLQLLKAIAKTEDLARIKGYWSSRFVWIDGTDC